MIPRIIHYFWSGALPDWARGFIRGTVALHPDWAVIVHDSDAGAHYIDSRLRAAMAASGTLTDRNDIMRYVTLHRYGGVALDMDTVVFRDLEPLRNQTSWVTRTPGILKPYSLAACAAEPGSPLTSAILAEIARLHANVTRRFLRRPHGALFLSGVLDNENPGGVHELPEFCFFGLRTRDDAQEYFRAPPQRRSEIWNATGHPEQPYGLSLWGHEALRGPIGVTPTLNSQDRPF